MYQISAAQTRASRSLLRWMQEDLEKSSGVSVTTIRTFENGASISERSATKLRVAFEQSGIEFIEDEGVKWRNNVCIVHKGTDSCDKLFEDIFEITKKYGRDVLCLISTQEVMTEYSGLPSRTNLERIIKVNEITEVKCVASEFLSSVALPSSLESRILPQTLIGAPETYFVYGNKYAHIVRFGLAKFIVVIYDLELNAETYRKHFIKLWEQGINKKK